MSPPATRLVCHGCGYVSPDSNPHPYRCPDSGDDRDHVLGKLWRGSGPGGWDAAQPLEVETPFLRYRSQLHSYQVWRSRGGTEPGWRGLIERLEDRLAEIDGRGFRPTPCRPHAALARHLGMGPEDLWIKDETGNVSGSHKARHLMGLALWLEVVQRTKLDPDPPALGIASCGNAALAAAIVARAANRPLEVFVPTSAPRHILARLHDLNARIQVCPRQGGDSGDPCVRRLQERLERGDLLPFTCQGNENGLVLEGAETLAYEVVETLDARHRRADQIFIQVGGGALASAAIEGWRRCVRLGLTDRMPRVHTVQTRGGSPLHRAWRLVGRRMLGQVGGRPRESDSAPPSVDQDLEIAARLASLPPDERRAALSYAATHRSEFMWPWETTPRSLATGILDDETYDWWVVVEAMIETGGIPLVVSEDTLARAHRLSAEATSIPAEPTGTAGLAGMLDLQAANGVSAGDLVTLLYTGAERRP